MTTNLEALSRKYLDTKNSELLGEIYSLAKSEASIWIRRNKFYSINEMPTDFSNEVAMDYVYRLSNNKLYENKLFVFIVRNICRDHARRFVTSKIISDINVDYASVKNDTDSKIEFDDMIRQAIHGCERKIKTYILYCMYFGNINIVKRAKPYLTSKEYTILSMKAVLMMESDNKFLIEKYMPTTSIGRSTLIIMLMNKYPELFTLLNLIGDFKKFFQFLILYENSTISVPGTHAIVGDFVEMSKAMKRLEDDESPVSDIKLIEDLVIKHGNKYDLLDNLPAFISRILEESLESYKALNESLVERVKKGKGVNITEIYKEVNNQVKAQVGLLKVIGEITDKKLKVEEELNRLNTIKLNTIKLK